MGVPLGQERLKQAASIDSSTKLQDAIREYNHCKLARGSSPADVEVFIHKYTSARALMLEQQLIKDDAISVAREMQDFKDKIQGTEIEQFLNDLDEYPTMVDSLDSSLFPKTLLGRIRQWLRPRLPKADPTSLTSQAGSLLTTSAQKGKGKDQVAQLTQALLVFDKARLAATRSYGNGGRAGYDKPGRPQQPHRGECKACDDTHPECSQCPNDVAKRLGFDISKLVKTGTRCDYMHAADSRPCNGRGHLRQHHCQTAGANSTSHRKSTTGKDKGSSSKGKRQGE